jgi:hypothetical protein
MQSISRVMMLFATILMGCNDGANQGALGDPVVDFPLGSSRQQLYVRHTPGHFVRIMETEPEDSFAAATIYEMIRLGKTRPRSYEIFRTRGPDGVTKFRDYVFYNDLERVVYVARQRD